MRFAHSLVAVLLWLTLAPASVALAEDAAGFAAEAPMTSVEAPVVTESPAAEAQPAEMATDAGTAPPTAEAPGAAGPTSGKLSGKDAASIPEAKADETSAVQSQIRGRMGARGPGGFGYNIFKSDALPITEGPVDDQYLISPGDEIVVSIWGELVETFNLIVSEGGFIELPDKGGRIHTNGVTLSDLRQKIVQSFSQIRSSYINATDPTKSTSFIDVRLGKLRKLSIFVVGEVRSPGAYTVSPGVANVINLLYTAKGVTEAGSLRQIKVRRRNGAVDVIDLYGFFLTGIIDFKKLSLQPGDYIIVPLKQRAVAIDGEVRRPNNYELIEQEGLRELLNYAGGFTPDAYRKNIHIQRKPVNQGAVVIDVDAEDVESGATGNVELLDGDRIRVGKTIENRSKTVAIKGDGVTRPGTYGWAPGMTLVDLVNKADGLKDSAYLERVDILRTDDDYSKSLLVVSLKDALNHGADGRYAYHDGSQQTVLRDMDEVTIQSIYGMSGEDRHVRIEGHVKSPGATVLARGMRLYDLIFLKGGFQDTSYRNATFLDIAHIVRSTPGKVGSRLIPFNLGALLAGDPDANLELEDNDVVRVYSDAELRADNQVTIKGFVKKAGSYPLSEDLTLEDLLVLSGGLTDDRHLLEAAITRLSPIDATVGLADAGGGHVVDQYAPTVVVAIDPSTYAETPVAKRTAVHAGDRIIVRLRNGTQSHGIVYIDGEVPQPGYYPLLSASESLSSLLQRTGGIKESGFPEGATFKRRSDLIAAAEGNAEDFAEIAINLPAALADRNGPDDVILRDGDSLYVPGNPDVVEVRGAVRRPMILKHKAGQTLDEYVALCGGYLDKADTGRTVVYSANKTAVTGKSRQSDVASGSVIEVPFQNESERLRLVEVKGAVQRPAVFEYKAGARLGHYLNMSGGFKPNADVQDISVILPDGGLLVGSNKKDFNPEIPPGSLINVSLKSRAESK